MTKPLPDKLPVKPYHETTKQLGDDSELKALRYLEARGCQLITRQYRSRAGEIDLIVEDNDTIVFVEVRYRKDTSRGTGAETITTAKIRKIIRTAHYFLIKHKQFKHHACRFDVISMDDSIDWIKRAFTLDDQ